MILVTVGTQLNFSRLIDAVDEWCVNSGYSDVVYQMGGSPSVPKMGQVYDYIPADKMDELFSKADVIVGHAGMGTILSALSKSKPVVIMPRRFSLGEHRNDHQLATFEKFTHLAGVYGACSEGLLAGAIEAALQAKSVARIDQYASTQLIEYLQREIY